MPTNTQETALPAISLRQYAAIMLRVPDSGIDWLDQMIRNARHHELTQQALAAIISRDDALSCQPREAARWALMHADHLYEENTHD